MPGVASGSWFPTGFHGHFRSHMRNDIYQEYRREARPEPPHVFEKRIKEQPTNHIFSRHDNRHIFPSSVYVFENGMGKKKMLNARESYNVLRWVPLEKNLEMQTPLLSTYRMDFWEHGPTTEKMPQLIVPRLSSTSYPGIKINRQLFWSPQSRQNLAIDRTHSKVPEQPTLKDSIPKTAHSRTSSSSLRRIVSSPCKRLTVSDCLNWHSQENINQKNIEKE
ncbi:hypothetical protein XENTR_v10012829 [Xenopus tropicalis]|uniref:Chromosome 4 C3orf84 homolog n=1 Tax=Xenopus tropicalis TaxID=8364 RepID=A0A6I8T1G4_XENTR|nr:uncharacterized protein C3orf84 homolog isoform X2 [Xenopus tropicalis]KAE8612360.1 hypothetical protein XENTR_v10012829 [Xenopus tropicalis]|eukprot:XP_002933100.1 PREDICTED: uncharacterized protein C3orf84 homolog isoform X2 [Xenopus tropicalis]